MAQSNDPTDFVYVPLHVELYADLVRRSGGANVSGLIHHAVDGFLQDTVGDPSIWSAEYIGKVAEEEDKASREKYGDPGRGYQWQNLFLPNGTQVRMKYAHRDTYAEIRQSQFCFGEESLSPSQFARRVANNTNRNAWRDLYIKFPGEASWKLADSLRQVKPLSLDALCNGPRIRHGKFHL